MKRITLILALVLAMLRVTYAQERAFNKITPDLQAELDKRPSADEMFRITIVMADKYDQSKMSKQVQFMKKAERRAYVINELQRFSKASQYDLMQLLEEGTKANTVTEVNQFWIFNGISCITNREMIAHLSQRKDIDYIESDEIRNMLPEEWNPVKVKEQLRGLAWHVSQVHADDVWNLGYDGTGVVVAIIDTGVNYNHVDLADHMWDGGSSYPNHGYDFVNSDNNPMDDANSGHGTHCAGIVAGDGTSGTQTGIAPNATIMALKVLGANGSGSQTGIQNAMQFAMNNGADVVSMSLGGSGQSGNRTYRQIFVNMMNAGIIASVAAGNDGEYYSSSHLDPDYNTYYAVPKNVGSPGNCPPPWHHPDQTLTGGQSAVVTVGASNRNDRKSTFSSFGPVTWYSGSSWFGNGYEDYRYQANSSTNIGLIKPDVIAPSTDITSSSNTDNTGFKIMPGTSMATPCVAGIMALLLDVNPTLSPAQIDEILETTAFPVEFRVSKNNYTGAGRADALAAVDAVLTQATEPTNLSLSTCGGNVNLNWTASTAPAGYCIYRDNMQVGTTAETTYTDENVGAGKHVYYVRANDNSGRQSVHSNSVLCTIEPYASVPEDLTIGWDGTNAELDWEGSTVSNTLTTATLSFSESPYTAYGGSNSTMYWGMCFNPEELRPYQGMSIDQVSIPIYTTDIAYTLCIYRGTTYGNTTGTPVYTQSFTPTSGNWAYQTMTLTTPYALTDISQDLWITFSATLGSSTGYPLVVGEYDGPNSNCFYMGSGSSANDICWSHIPDFGSDYNYAVCIKAHLTRTTDYTATYNVYLDNSSKASNLSVLTYTDQPTLHSDDNIYTVTAKVGNNESCPSNEAKIVVIDDAQTVSDIDINESLIYIVAPEGILSTNGSLISTDPSRLIIEDGGQLVSNQAGVKATIHKNISAYSGTLGWNFIASPMTSLTVNNTTQTNIVSDNFDLYRFNQSPSPTTTNGKVEYLEWENWKSQGSDHDQFDLELGKGYLYAHNPDIDAVFIGELANPKSGEFQVRYSADNPDPKMHGWNLIGNPFAYNAYINRSYYKMNDDRNGIQVVGDNAAILPCTGIMVKTENTSGETVIFTKEPQTNGAKGSLNINLAKAGIRDNAILDNAIITFNKDNELSKFFLVQSDANIYFPQNNEEYAIAYSQGMGEMPLNFVANQDGHYNLGISSQDVSFNYLHLIDNMTGADVDLLKTPSYSFDARTSDYESRFKLVFISSSRFEDEDGDNDSFAFNSNGSWIIANDVGATIQVIDMTGHIINSEHIDGSCNISFNVAPGLYVLRLINGNNIQTQKIVIE